MYPGGHSSCWRTSLSSRVKLRSLAPSSFEFAGLEV